MLKFIFITYYRIRILLTRIKIFFIEGRNNSLREENNKLRQELEGKENHEQ